MEENIITLLNRLTVALETIAKCLDKNNEAASIKPAPDKNLLNFEVQYLGFTVRTLNALHSSFINTIEDLIQFSRKDLTSARSIGLKTIDEIVDRLAEFDIELPKRSSIPLRTWILNHQDEWKRERGLL